MNLIFKKLRTVIAQLQYTLNFEEPEKEPVLEEPVLEEPVLEEPTLEDIVKQYGFPSLAEAKRLVNLYNRKLREKRTMAGNLVNDRELVQNIQEQIPNGRVGFYYRRRQDLAPMRDLIKYICLLNGYIPKFDIRTGKERFYIEYMPAIERDVERTRYYVPIRRLGPPVDLVFELPEDIRLKLLD